MSEESQRSSLNLMPYPKFQGPTILLVVMTGFLALFSLGAFTLLQTKILLNHAEKVGTTPHVTNLLWQYGLVCGGIFLVGLFTMVLWGLLLTHKLIGPIKRLKKELDEMHQNESVHLLSVRENDYLRPFIKRINKVFWGLSSHPEWDKPDQISEKMVMDEVEDIAE